MNRLAFIIVLLLPSTCFGQTIAQFCPLNDNAASTTIVATVGTALALAGGKNTNAIPSATGPGNLITASLNFDGTATDYINSSTFFQRANNTAGTFSFWVNLDSVTTQHLAGTTGNGNHRVTIASSTTIEVRDSATTRTYTVPAMATGTWYNVLVTFDTSNNCKVFVNGVESSTGSQTVAAVLSTALARSFVTGMDGRMAWVKRSTSDDSAIAASYYYAEGVPASGAVVKILLQLSDARLRRQTKHFDTYGVYALAP